MYLFERVPSGSYTVRVEKGGFVPRVPPPVGQAPVVELNPDQRTTLDVQMERAGAIEGRLTNAFGEPIANASMLAVRRENGKELAGSTPVMTDDLGRFRLHTLRPGEYGVVGGSEVRTVELRAGELVYVELSARPLPAEVVAQGQAPARAAAVPPGGARVDGQVLRSDTNSPWPFANVAYTEPSGRGGTSKADAEGRFTFDGLKPETYTFAVALGGFSSLDFAKPRAVSVTLAEGATKSVVMKAPPPGTIEGQLVDEFGDPVPGAQVKLLQQQFVRAGVGSCRDEGRNTGLTTTAAVPLFRFAAWRVLIEAVTALFDARSPGSRSRRRIRADVFSGTERQAAAKAITLGDGDQVAGLTIRCAPPLARFFGSVVDASFNPVAAAARFSFGATEKTSTWARRSVLPRVAARLTSATPGG